ncbi:MAG: PIN domain-containing protein [Fibromonadaceae bacterium]|jgi:predicted nucleic acid-binding protein|nr:PIN domain-containing protein [Fibromonadaceae bacterium]
MKILIDTDIILDFLTNRKPFFNESYAVIQRCLEDVDGYISAHSVNNIFYILRKRCSIEERRHLIYEICNILEVAGINKEQIFNSINNESFVDFEDCLQVECAKSKGVDFIVTRNTSDFLNSEIKVILPKDFCSHY